MEDIKPWEGGPWVPLMNDSSAGRLFLLKASGPTRPRFTPTTATTKRRKVLPDSLLRSSSGAWRKNIIVSEWAAATISSSTECAASEQRCGLASNAHVHGLWITGRERTQRPAYANLLPWHGSSAEGSREI